MERKLGKCWPSKVAVLIKYAADGTILKVRLIHDLRRSGVNSKGRVQERLVLPRIGDALIDILELLEAFPGLEIEMETADFKDAFKQMRAGELERKYLCGKALGGWFFYKTVLFGLGSGPLLWGRIAAALMRSTISMVDTSRCRIECFVDDPLMIQVGGPAERRRRMLMIVCWWCALRSNLSWQKMGRGTSIDWIGARLQVDIVKRQAVVTLPAKKLQQLRDETTVLLRSSRGMCFAVPLRALAGLGGCVGSMIPQVRSFIRRLWAALAAPRAPGKLELVFVSQIRLALEWLLAFGVANADAPISRVIFAFEQHHVVLTIESDASPFGGGAVLWWGPPQGRRHRWPAAWVACTWTPADADLMACPLESPDGQARWEAFMMVLALRQWMQKGLRGRVCMIGDAEGILGALTRLRSADEIVNLMAMELALWIAPRGLSLEGVHIWGEENAVADKLSRLSQGARVPQQLQDIPKVDLLPRGKGVWKFLGTR